MSLRPLNVEIPRREGGGGRFVQGEGRGGDWPDRKNAPVFISELNLFSLILIG